MDLVVAEAMAPFHTEKDNPCLIKTQVVAYPIKFEGGTYAIIQANDRINNAKLSDGTTKRLAKSIGSIEELAMVELPENATYALMGDDPCQQSVELTTLPRLTKNSNAAIDVSKEMFEAIAAWQRLNEKQSVPLEGFLNDYDDVDFIERLFVVQQTVYQNAPYPDRLLKKLHNVQAGDKQFAGLRIPTEGFGSQKNKSNCSCRTLRLSSNNIAEPESGVYTNNTGGKNIYGIYDSNTEMQASNRIKTWAAWAYEGPGRYQEIWADTESGACIAAPYTFTWNDVSDDDFTSDEAIFPATRATLRFNMLCSDGRNLPSNCGCELEVRFQAAYKSEVRARAEFNDRFNIFCRNDHRALASAEDYVMLAHGNDDLNGEFEMLTFNVNNQTVDCGMNYVGPEPTDVIALGLYTFAAIKGAPIAAGTAPIISTAIQLAYGQYATNGINSSISSIFDSRWRQFNGACGGALGGRVGGLTPFSDTYEGTIFLKPNEIQTIMLAADSRLRVAGQRRWEANARVLSSYRLTSIIRPAISEGTPFDDLCCSPAAVTYTMSTRDNTSGPGRVESRSWQNQVEAYLSLWGINHDVRGEVGSFLGPNPNGCNSDVDIVINKNESSVATSKLLLNERYGAQLERIPQTKERLRIVTSDGRVVHEADISGDYAQPIRINNLKRGIYFISVTRSDGSLYTTKTIAL